MGWKSGTEEILPFPGLQLTTALGGALLANGKH